MAKPKTKPTRTRRPKAPPPPVDAPTSDSETVEMFDPSTIAPGGNEMTQAQLLASTGASAEFPSGATHSRTQTDGSRQVVTSGAVA